jgi:hypothetical protein
MFYINKIVIASGLHWQLIMVGEGVRKIVIFAGPNL